jgi:tetratricopeptide (TPR) repeat protein
MTKLCETKNNKIQSVMTLFSKGQINEALIIIETLIKDYPNEALLYNINGAICQADKKFDDAILKFELATIINPSYYEAYYNQGVVYQEIGNIDKAVKCYENAIALNKDYINAYNNLGTIYMNHLNKLDIALDYFQKIILLDPLYAPAYNNIGSIYEKQEKNNDAIINFRKAASINSNYDIPYNSLGIIFAKIGQIDNAIENFEKAIAINQKNGQAYYNLGKLKKYTKSDPHISNMETLISNNNLSQESYVYFCFSLAKAYEDLEKQEESFKFLHKGNQLCKQKFNYSIDKDKILFSIIKKLFSSSLNNRLSLSSSLSKLSPIFIVGMPRSGTTLVEQIISNHSSVYGGGELPILNYIFTEILNDYTKYEESGFSEELLLSIRQKYLDHLSRLNVPENIITDKYVLNFKYIGFILLLFPNAKIIHLKRDVVATCWSNYKTHFTSYNMTWTYNLEDIANYYILYTNLMDFWNKLFTNKIYNLCYENLTMNQEEETRKLLNFCELDWEEKCLNFHTNKRSVSTASHAQVRQKMYHGSSKKWEKYKIYLEPLIKILDSNNILLN